MNKIILVSESSLPLAQRIKLALPESEIHSVTNRQVIADSFAQGHAIIFIGAMGICVRTIAPYIADKHTDPAVVCLDSAGRTVVSVLSGHVGGANQLAQTIATITGGQAIITTQSDNANLWPLDTLARDYDWTMQPIDHAALNAAIAHFVARRPTALIIEADDRGTQHLQQTLPNHVTLYHSVEEFLASNPQDQESPAPQTPEPQDLQPQNSKPKTQNSKLKTQNSKLKTQNSKPHLTLLISPRLHTDELPGQVIRYTPRCLHLGIGCQANTSDDAADAILEKLRELDIAPEAIASIATVEKKKDEPMLAKLQTLLPAAQLRIFTADQLAEIEVPNPSDRVAEAVGCPSVAEAAAIVSGTAAALIVEKQKGEICICQSDEPALAFSDEPSSLSSAPQPLKTPTPLLRQHFTYAIAQDHRAHMRGHIEIVGAGPGDPDLVSVRGRKFLEQADLILYAGSLVPRELTDCHKPGAVVRSSADMDLDEQFALMQDFYNRGLLVVRLHTGDPCIYGAIQEQMAYFDAHGMHYHITPGISSFLAAAAELRSQFTIPERCQTIILTRGEGRTPMPDKEKLHLLAQHQSTMCIFLSASIVDQVQAELLTAYPPETPVAACYKLTWKEQRIYRGQLKDLADIVRTNHLTLTTMIVVGEAIDNRQGQSQLYAPTFTHLFRKGK